MIRTIGLRPVVAAISVLGQPARRLSENRLIYCGRSKTAEDPAVRKRNRAAEDASPATALKKQASVKPARRRVAQANKTIMKVSFAQRTTPADDVLVQMLDGEAVLLNLNTESYFGLDEVGARMWTLLTESDSIQTAYEALLEEYDVTPEQLRADLAALIDRLVEQGLITLGADATME